MKKIILTLLAVTTFCVNANALSAKRSREEARFLTDKMIYELNLTEDQADDVYEINYDYFRTLGPIDEAYDIYFERRYNDLSYVLYDWQWDYFLDREYFLRPAYIYRGGWAFAIYNFYAHTHFFHGLPRAYHHYHGGHYGIAHYYRDHRFDMHRRTVAAMPRPAVRRADNRFNSHAGSRGYRIENMNRGNRRQDMNRVENHNNRVESRGNNRVENRNNRVESRGNGRVENNGRQMRSSTRSEVRTERSSARQSMGGNTHRQAPTRSMGSSQSSRSSNSHGNGGSHSRGAESRGHR